MNNAHPPGWALFVLWGSWAHRKRWSACRAEPGAAGGAYGRRLQAGAGQLVEGWGEQGAEASAGAGVSEVDGVRNRGWCVSSSSSSPTGIASSFFGTVLPIARARITLATALEMRVETLWWVG